MDYLRDKMCYLSGPIEHDAIDSSWRDKPKKILVEEFGINLYDPFTDPKQQWVPALEEARAKEDYPMMRKISRKFVRKDLSKVDKADMVIACLPWKVPTTGTVHEIVNSNNSKKPTLLVCEQGKKHLPAWYFAYIPHEVMFGSWDECFEYLRDVNRGKYIDNDRWSLIYDMV